jgi:hypothetical protein
MHPGGCLALGHISPPRCHLPGSVMRLFLLALVAVLVAVAVPSARAQTPLPEGWEEWRALGDGVVATRTTLSAPGTGGARRGKVSLARFDKKRAPAGEAIAVYDGAAASTALGAREGAAAVVLFRGGTQPFVKVAVVDLTTRAVRTVDLDRTAGAGYAPTAAVVCADPDGFTVLWQEEVRGNPQAEARSTFARVKADGTVLARPAAVPIPWSLGAIVDDGRGYTLAVNYDGTAPDQTRICFVTLTRDGKPEQHPWWGSRPSAVDEVQLVAVAGKVTAVYRSGGALLSAVADKTTGQWGKEADPSRTVATGLQAGAPYAVRAGAGSVEVVHR